MNFMNAKDVDVFSSRLKVSVSGDISSHRIRRSSCYRGGAGCGCREKFFRPGMVVNEVYSQNCNREKNGKAV